MKHIIIKTPELLKQGYYFDVEKRKLSCSSEPLTFSYQQMGSIEVDHDYVVDHVRKNKEFVLNNLSSRTLLPINIFTCYWYFDIKDLALMSVKTFIKSENDDVNKWLLFIKEAIDAKN